MQIYKIFKDFKDYQKLFNNITEFRPHYISYKSPEYSPNNTQAIPNCISKGLYCSSPRYDLSVSDGRDILTEDIRQKCIYLISKGKFESKLLELRDLKYDESYYWSYMENFFEGCLNRTVKIFHYYCAMSALEKTGLNKDLVNECSYRSYVPENDKIAIDLNNNTILEDESRVKKLWKIKVLPTLMVNNKTIQGSWNVDNLFEAICAGYLTKPQVCYDKGYFVRSEYNSTGISFSAIFWIILIVIILNVLIYIVCKRYILKKINDRIENADINGRINTVVTSYLALKDSPA